MSDTENVTQHVSWAGDDECFQKGYELFMDELYGNTEIERDVEESLELTQELTSCIRKSGKENHRGHAEFTQSACQRVAAILTNHEARLHQEVNVEENEIQKLEKELSKRKMRVERLEGLLEELDVWKGELGYHQYFAEKSLKRRKTTRHEESEDADEESEEGDDDEEPDEDGGEEYDEESDEGYDKAEYEAEYEAERKRLLDEQHDVDTGQIEIYYEPIPDRPGRVWKKIRYL
mmetsp:Transcript_67278/g.185395  ORF Transcript_67278/g.185395 Transcript_67278/m.185395 type:complete len:234 (+) Transcript_67278:517-1218(+)